MSGNTTPVPNIVFDEYLKNLKLVELKVFLIVIRQTLGWQSKNNRYARKEMDWISLSQLVNKTGTSSRAINDAIKELTNKKLIEVLSQSGEILDTPEKRKGQQKLYFKLSNANIAVVENKGNIHEQYRISKNTNAIFAINLRKNVTELTQKMRITKEILQN